MEKVVLECKDEIASLICYELICIMYPQYLVLLIFDKKNCTSAKHSRSNLIMTDFAKLGKRLD